MTKLLSTLLSELVSVFILNSTSGDGHGTLAAFFSSKLDFGHFEPILNSEKPTLVEK